MYVSTKDQAKIVRNQLKQFKGVKFSVTSDYNSIRVTYTRNPLVVTKSQVEAIVCVFEKIDRCERSGDILMGANTYVTVTEDRTTEQVAEMKAYIENNFHNPSEWDWAQRNYREQQYWNGELV